MNNTVIENYDEEIVKKFSLASMFWVVAGLLAGVYLALELTFPALNFDLPWLNFGRLRPLHTSAVIFAFGGNILFASSFYIVQRTCQVGLWANNFVKNFIFWGYQLFIVIAAVGYLCGVTQGLEYAEPEWYADLFLTVIWVMYAVVFIGTVVKRKEEHIYVANWFFIAFILVVAVLHLGNNVAVPIRANSIHSVSAYSGVQSALIQWWYGHNAVGFFLTAAFLGLMYYFIPKQAERPVYSYRLSVVHFWSLIFFYVWAGPHHLLYTSLPDWTQSLGMVMSVILWIPSWGGMINGLMTLSGAWHKLRTDPVLRFMITAVAFYGMGTFEGPLMSIKAVNSLSHYTEWTVGHVHSPSLGWVALISFSALYYMVPAIWNKQGGLYSIRLVEWHFWLSTIGIALYTAALWVAGITQGLMWRTYDDLGYLKYSFIESVVALHPAYIVRSIAGLLFLAGTVIMIYNLLKTMKIGNAKSNNGVA